MAHNLNGNFLNQEIAEYDRRAHVAVYPNTASYPFEIGEKVWVVKPEYRAPLGEFVIRQALPDDKFELVLVSDNSVHEEHVEGQYLRRDPYGIA